MHPYLTILLIVAMSIAIIEDIRCFKIPNWVTFPTMITAIMHHAVLSGFDGFLFSIFGLLAGIGLFLIPYIIGGMGAGDAKLMGAAGAIIGPEGIFIASILVVLAGGMYGLGLFALNFRSAKLLFKRNWIMVKTFLSTMQIIPIPRGKDEKKLVLRYAIPIAVGTISYLVIEMKGYDLLTQIIGFHISIFSG